MSEELYVVDFEIANMDRYEFFKILHKYDKNAKWVAKQYRHLKRCKNRKILYEKRRLI